MKFVYPNAKFEAIGNPFVNSKELDSIAENKDISALKEKLNSLRDYNVTGEDISSVQKSLDQNFIQTVEMMRKDSQKKLGKLYDAYLEKIDIVILKNELKKLLLGKPLRKDAADEMILQENKKLIVKLQNAKKEDVPQILTDYGFQKSLINLISAEKSDFLAIDMEFDKHFIINLAQVKVPYKCEKARQSFVQHMIDIVNIKNVLRAKQLGYDIDTCKKFFVAKGAEIASWVFDSMSDAKDIPDAISVLEGTSYYSFLNNAMEHYNKDKSVQVFENALDTSLLKIVKDISIQNYVNLGPTLRFLVSKEFEIKNLKIITKGVGENLSSDFTKSLLIKEVA